MSLIHRAAALAAAALLSAPVLAAPSVWSLCSDDVSVAGATLVACYGYDAGNTLNSKPNNYPTDLTLYTATGVYSGALGLNGYTGPNIVPTGSAAGSTWTLPKDYTGLTLIGIHWGKGDQVHNGTGYYLFDLGAGTDVVTANMGGASGLNVMTAVPEASTTAMFAAGLGVLGVVASRRRRQG